MGFGAAIGSLLSGAVFLCGVGCIVFGFGSGRRDGHSMGWLGVAILVAFTGITMAIRSANGL